jgi:hypothetical protein
MFALQCPMWCLVLPVNLVENDTCLYTQLIVVGFSVEPVFVRLIWSAGIPSSVLNLPCVCPYVVPNHNSKTSLAPLKTMVKKSTTTPRFLLSFPFPDVHDLSLPYDLEYQKVLCACCSNSRCVCSLFSCRLIQEVLVFRSQAKFLNNLDSSNRTCGYNWLIQTWTMVL